MEEVVEEWKTTVTKVVEDIIAAKNKNHIKAEDLQDGSETEVTQTPPGQIAEAKLIGKEEKCLVPIDGIEKTAFRDELPLYPTSMPKEVMTLAEVADAVGYTELITTPIDPSKLPRCKAFCCDRDAMYRIAIDGDTDVINHSSERSNLGSNESKGINSNESADIAEYTSDNPLTVPVLGARWLTHPSCPSNNRIVARDWSEAKRVINLDLSVKNATLQFQYQTGDSIGVCCSNPLFLVDITVSRLKIAHGESSIDQDTPIYCKASGKVTALKELLRYKFDLVGIPRKANVLSLAQVCTSDQEKLQMQHLCSKGEEGKALWSQFIEGQMLGMGDLLILFPSCTPTVSQLLANCYILPPRFYSIASSPLLDPRKLSVAFSVVHNLCRVRTKKWERTKIQGGGIDAFISGEDSYIRRYGLATSQMETLLTPWLRPIGDSRGDGGSGGREAVPSIASTSTSTSTLTSTSTPMAPITLRIFHKPSISFHLPGSMAIPLIFIGPGTGVAPFIGFLEHRRELERARTRSTRSEELQGCWRGSLEFEEEDLPSECSYVEGFIQSLEPGPIHMFFGCRNEEDFLYKEELQTFVKDHTLTTLDVAMSRVGKNKRYVQHCIRERGKVITDLILHQGAYVYICGDGNRMAKDVYAALVESLVEYGCESGIGGEEQADSYFKEMRARSRYLLDIWS